MLCAWNSQASTIPQSESVSSSALGPLCGPTFELWYWTRLESPLDSREVKPINPEGNQPWVFIERTDAEAEAPVLWPPGVKSRLIGNDPDAGKDWRQEKGMAEGEMVGRHHWLSRHEHEQTGRQWRKGIPGILQPKGSHRVGSDWATEQYLG